MMFETLEFKHVTKAEVTESFNGKKLTLDQAIKNMAAKGLNKDMIIENLEVGVLCKKVLEEFKKIIKRKLDKRTLGHVEGRSRK